MGNGKVEAKLYDFGEYPGAVEQKRNYVYGELYEASNLAKVLPVLDKYEEYDHSHPTSSLFVRKVRNVLLENGKKVPAIIYFYNHDVTKEHLVGSGKREWVLNRNLQR